MKTEKWKKNEDVRSVYWAVRTAYMHADMQISLSEWVKERCSDRVSKTSPHTYPHKFIYSAFKDTRSRAALQCRIRTYVNVCVRVRVSVRAQFSWERSQYPKNCCLNQSGLHLFGFNLLSPNFYELKSKEFFLHWNISSGFTFFFAFIQFIFFKITFI